MAKKHEILSGRVMDELTMLSLQELSRACRVEKAWLMQLVEEGILEPQGRDRGCWHFSGNSLRRVLIVRRLQDDLGINLQGAALAMDLMQEIDILRARLNRFE
jgi:chaperone modulatory protein CbpM